MIRTPPRTRCAQAWCPCHARDPGLLCVGFVWWRQVDCCFCFYWDALRAGQMPEVYRDKRGTHYMVTQGGNKVGVTVDKQGRAFFVDKAGDLFYDSGDPKIGFYVVRCLRCRGMHQVVGVPRNQSCWLWLNGGL